MPPLGSVYGTRAGGSMVPGELGGELRAYEPSWRDRLAAALLGDNASQTRREFVNGLLGSTGLGNSGPGPGGSGAIDYIPGGQIFGAQESAQGGDIQGAAIAMMPIPGASKLGAVAREGEAAAAKVARSFKPAIPEGQGYATVLADVEKLNASLAKDADMYVGPGGAGGTMERRPILDADNRVTGWNEPKNRYDLFGDFDKTGAPIEMPRLAMNQGEATVGNGRHRFAYLRDQGETQLPVQVADEYANEFKSKFGALPRLRGAENASPDVISTRMPTGKTAPENPFTDYLKIDTDATRTDPKLYEHNVNLARQYPNLPKEVTMDGSVEDVRKALHQQGTDNLLWLHDQVPAATRERSKLWYDGANTIAQERAKQYGVPTSSVAGVYAALSPQKDWYQNVSLGDRVMDIVLRQRGRRSRPSRRPSPRRCTRASTTGRSTAWSARSCPRCRTTKRRSSCARSIR